MSDSALVIGFGSIGKRHFKILSDLLGQDNVRVLTNQKNLPINFINSLDKIPEKINYVVLANETSKHREYLNFLVDNIDVNKVLVEKPLFDDFYEFDSKGKSIYVGYNLRFHPLIQKLKNLIAGKEVTAIYCCCHSYLPDWRKERHFSQSYSSSANGGGVILDLSHEIDLILWLFGQINIDFVKTGNFSSLDLQSEDSMFLSGHLDNGSPVEISLSYFSTIEKREIHVVTNEETYIVDLINNIFYSRESSSKLLINDLTSFDINKTYIDQHESILTGNVDENAILQDGMKINRFIKQIKLWNQK